MENIQLLKKKENNTINMILKKEYVKYMIFLRSRSISNLQILIDYVVFYAVSTIFRPYNGEKMFANAQ